MDFLIWFFVFILGTIIGSFLNVVILRYNTGKSIASGKSACFSCAKRLSWYEMFPILSFAALRGKCGSCKSKISWQYPLVEFCAGLLFLSSYLKLGSSTPKYYYLYYLAIFSILIVIAVYDLRHKIIPDLLSFSFAFISLAWLVFIAQPTSHVGWDGWANWDWWNLFSGPILALPFFLMWFFSGGRWMGLGDAKLALGMGWFLGLVSGISAVILGFWIGAAVSLLSLLAQRLNLIGKNLTIKSEVPFAPFLILGLLFVFFFGFDITNLNILFSK
ncbi:MAG: prepilin peptidase [Patescibacteria group bacterium]|nr:prepilin peptidase [Patescibacteria group bacterium]MDE2218248.1 prepilin peptidase [Patescibacteria group bacterium]